MKTFRKTCNGTGKVALALIGCMLFPVLIWVGLGAGIYQRNRPSKIAGKEETDLLSWYGLKS
jgi:hypothetical protein